MVCGVSDPGGEVGSGGGSGALAVGPSSPNVQLAETSSSKAEIIVGANRTRLFINLSSGAFEQPLPSRANAADPSVIRVCGVTQAITKEIEGEDGDDDPGDRQHQPRIKRHDVDVLSFVEEDAPTRHRWPEPETEE